MDALFANRPTAQQAMKAAIDFGQEDDITVLTLTRLAEGVRVLHFARRALAGA